MSYQPFTIGSDKPEDITSGAYRDFLRNNVISTGLDLMYERSLRRSAFPFPDTKFDPNSGTDLPPSQYNRLFTWFLGRGGESWAAHLEALDSISTIAAPREALREMLQGQLQAQVDAIARALRLHAGRIPFCVDRSLRGIDADGNHIPAPSKGGCNASELFCAKALIAGGNDTEVDLGRGLLLRFVDAAFHNGYEDDTAAYAKDLHAESPFMLALGAIAPLVRRGESSGTAELAARMLDYVLDNFYDESDGSFCELIDFSTREKQPLFLPGHAAEFVGLGLQAVDALEASGASLSSAVHRSFARAKTSLPAILIHAVDFGYDEVHHGLRQSVDAVTGSPTNTDLPWWGLTETMRAAVRALLSSDEPALRRPFLAIYRRASNDYFAHYPNTAMRLFPFRTRSGETGKVKNLMPVIPEADPLYHSNLAVLDILAMLPRL